MKNTKKIIMAATFVIALFASKNVFAKDLNVYEGNISGGNGYESSLELSNTYSNFYNLDEFNLSSFNDQPLNCEILQDLGTIVYGDYSSVKNNTFQEKKNGYFKQNGVLGEYKYLGVDLYGQPFLNPNYVDVNVENSMPLQPRFIDSIRKTYLYKQYAEKSDNLALAVSNSGSKDDTITFLNELETPDGIKMKDFLKGRNPLYYAFTIKTGLNQEMAIMWVREENHDKNSGIISYNTKVLVFSSKPLNNLPPSQNSIK